MGSTTAIRVPRPDNTGSRATWLLIGALGVGSALLCRRAASAGPAFDSILEPLWLAAALGLAELLVAHLHVGRSAHTFTASEIALTIGLVGASPSALLLAVLVGPTVVLGLRRDSPIEKLLFNIFQYELTTALSVLMYYWVGPGGWTDPRTWTAAIVATTVGTMTSAGLIAVAMATRDSTNVAATLARSLPVSLIVTWSNTATGLVVTVLWSTNRLAVTLVIPFAAVLLVSQRASESSRVLTSAVDLIGDVVREAGDVDDPEIGAPVILGRLKDALNADNAHLWLLPDRGRPLRQISTECDSLKAASEFRSSVAHALLGGVTSAVVSVGPASSNPEIADWARSSHLSRALVARLHAADRTLGLLVVEYSAAASRVERAEDLQVLESVAGHLALSLAKSHVEDAFSELRSAHRLLRYQASHDSLTGLANRAAFMAALESALSHQGRRSALLYFDLDGFKPVNDRLGHQAGDSVLIEVGRRLDSLVRTQDVAARLGGDEFAILLDNIPDDQFAESLARRVSIAMQTPIPLDTEDVSVGISIGVATATGGATDADTLIRSADTNMYRDKRRRRLQSQ